MPTEDRAALMETSVIGTIAVEAANSALRRMALEHASWQRFGGRRRPRRSKTT